MYFILNEKVSHRPGYVEDESQPPVYPTQVQATSDLLMFWLGFRTGTWLFVPLPCTRDSVFEGKNPFDLQAIYVRGGKERFRGEWCTFAMSLSPSGVP